MTTRTTTRIEVRAGDGPPRCTFTRGPLVPRRLRSAPGVVRVSPVAAGALLLAGDVVRVEVVVDGPVLLDVVETAGTVAYDMRGGSAQWHVDVELRRGARLAWAGEPFVAADGADVDRSLSLQMEEGCAAAMRESLVLGRTGEQGGTLRQSTRVRLDGSVLVAEDLTLDAGTRPGWVTLGGRRCLDTVSTFGCRLPEAPLTLQADGPASQARLIGVDLHRLDVAGHWAEARRLLEHSGAATSR